MKEREGSDTFLSENGEAGQEEGRRSRVESGCIGLEIFGPPHQTQKIFGRSAGVWLKFG